MHQYLPNHFRIHKSKEQIFIFFFKFKDVLPASLSSSVIYKYTCRECSASYIGMTSKQLKIRISQHMGRSFRTGNINSNEINNSKIFEHFEQKDQPIRVEDFKILTSCPNEDLFILESIYIHKLNPIFRARAHWPLCSTTCGRALWRGY